ncbi:MAG: hypothetical protein ACLSWI_05505 [Candidatus Gastranaerophilaceae bacterium]
MRWYDLDSSVCMAISMIELADMSTQVKCAKHIIQRAKELDPEMEFIKKVTAVNVSVTNYKRWYDKNETISTAFKYLKELSLDAQKTISNEIFAIIKDVTLV